MPNKRSVSLCKGQNNGVNSLNSGVSKVSTSPHSIHNGVTPNYMPKQSAHSTLNNISGGCVIIDYGHLWCTLLLYIV